MNSYKHSEISVKRRGGKIEDYLPIHDFMDCTKELCSDNRHRILHTIWGIRRVIIPIFGQVIKNSDGKLINVKDLCEQDHILPDYQNRFIPTLHDFISSINIETTNKFDFEKFRESYANDLELTELLLSPLSNSGSLSSLLITHNSWFINDIIPKIFKKKKEIKDFYIKPSDLFDNMSFRLWMDNGTSYPESCRLTVGKIVG